MPVSTRVRAFALHKHDLPVVASASALTKERSDGATLMRRSGRDDERKALLPLPWTL